jgi:translation initiation factor IF-3
MEQRSLRKKESSFSFSSEKSGNERKPKATRIIVRLHQFNFGIYRHDILTKGKKARNRRFPPI